MSHPEDFRDGVYAAEGHGANRGNGDSNTLEQAFRTQVARDAQGREPFGPDPRRDLPRDLNRDLPRDPMARDLNRDFSREEPRDAIRTPLHEGGSRNMGGRLVGSPLGSGNPLPAGNPLPGAAGQLLAQDAPRQGTPPGRALAVQPGADDAASARAMNLLKQALPFVKGLLPLLDGTIGAAVSNLIAARPHTPPPNVDITPIQNQITELQLQHNELRTTVQEQTTGIKRVEDQLEMVREATDRNTLEQQELIEDLKTMGNKVNLFAVVLSAMLLLSVLLNVVLYMHIKRVLP